MKPINNYENVKATGSFEKLPVGVYKLQIIGVKYQDNSAKGFSDQLLIQYDIAEGDYKGYFKKQYEENTSEDKKYKGIYRLYVPTEDGSEKDEWSKSKFKAFTNAVEESNSGYAWNWDENTLKDKFIGAVFNDKEYEYNGRRGFFTNLFKVISVSDMATASIPEPTLLKTPSKATNSSYDPSAGTGSDLDEIPFN